MIKDENILLFAKLRLAEEYPGLLLHDIFEVPGGWCISHYYPYSDFYSLRPLILNRWDGSLTEVFDELHNPHTWAQYYVDHLPEEQRRMAQAEWGKLPYHPVRFFPYRLELGWITDWAMLDNVTFAMEIDELALKKAGFTQMPDVTEYFRSVGAPQLLDESKQGDTIYRQYRIVFDPAFLHRSRTRFIEVSLNLSRPEKHTITKAMYDILWTTTLFADGELAPHLLATNELPNTP